MHEQLAERASITQRPEINQELRVRTDTTTWLAETLHGSMRTSFEYALEDNELRGEDGGSIDDIFDEAIAEAKIMTEWNPSLLFELRRRLIERDELNDMYKMLSGELPNTMVVISDFPPELKDAKEDVGGYNVSRQQTMMRIITVTPEGKLRITSQSLDSSNRKALEAIYKVMGESPEDGELLGQRIHRQLPEAWQDNLADNLTKVYDGSLTEQRGGEWHAGISQQPDRNMVNTYEFVLAQRDLIDWFTAEKMADPVKAEKLRYKLAATATARHERFLANENHHRNIPGTVSYVSVISVEQIANNRNLMSELDREERRAARSGKTFSGCGSSVKAGELGDSINDPLSSSGYGNKAGSGGSKSGECEFISKQCPECKTKNVKTKVTKTHIYGSCGCSKKR